MYHSYSGQLYDSYSVRPVAIGEIGILITKSFALGGNLANLGRNRAKRPGPPAPDICKLYYVQRLNAGEKYHLSSSVALSMGSLAGLA